MLQKSNIITNYYNTRKILIIICLNISLININLNFMNKKIRI